MSAPAREREPRPERRVGAAEDADRVRDRDAAEAEPTQQLVRLRLERRPPRPEPRVDRVADHHARHAGADRSPERRQVLAAEDAVDARDVRRLSASSRAPGSASTQAAAPSPRANATPYSGFANWREPSGPSARSSTGAKVACTPARRSAAAVSRPARNASAALRYRERGAPRRERTERPHRASLLVGEDDRPAAGVRRRRSTDGRARRRSPCRPASRRRRPPPPSPAASSLRPAPRPSPSRAARARSRSSRAPGHGTLAAMAVTEKKTALDPLDFLAIDALLDDEERAIRDTVRAVRPREGRCPTSATGSSRGSSRAS